MANKDATLSRPHILEADELQSGFVGQEEAIRWTARCFRNFIESTKIAGSDRTDVPIPVCSGMSGVGKTRLLEECSNILEEVLKVDRNDIVSVIVPYSKGFSPQPVEQWMPIEASLSWRLLYRVFLDKNCSLSFEGWFKVRLPRNGGRLTLERALEVVVRKIRGEVQDPATPLHLFLGIDDYQRIEEIGCRQREPNRSFVRGQVDAVGSLLCSQRPNVVLLPVFAGTDLSVIPFVYSTYYVFNQFPMALLTLDQVFILMESDIVLAPLLERSQVRHNLFTLGGVPRWVVKYLLKLKQVVESDDVDMDSIDECFEAVQSTCVNSYLSSLELRKQVRLAAFAISGRRVFPSQPFDDTLKWSDLRDSSQCLLDFSGYGIQVPYVLFEKVASNYDAMTSDTERSFAAARKDLIDLVDSKMFEQHPHQFSEMFGACFYAVRINALLVLGYLKVTLSELLPGAVIAMYMSNISVNLVPLRVFQCADAFGASTPQLISQQGDPSKTIDWTSSGCVAVHDAGEAGVDIFFALTDVATNKVIVFADQRKRELGQCQPRHAEDYLLKLSACPDFLVGTGARLVHVIMNCDSTWGISLYDGPPDCYLVGRDKRGEFYGALSCHPASSPTISIKSACKPALKTVLQGVAEDVDQLVDEIVRKRKEARGGFNNPEELRSFIETKRLRVQLDDQHAEFSAYS